MTIPQIIDPEVVTAIKAHPETDLRAVAHDLSSRFGRQITLSMVYSVRGNAERLQKISEAKDMAANKLTGALELAGGVKKELDDLFRGDKSRSLEYKDRIAAARELRMWTEMENKMAGVQDTETGTTFILEGTWNPVLPTEKNGDSSD